MNNLKSNFETTFPVSLKQPDLLRSMTGLKDDYVQVPVRNTRATGDKEAEPAVQRPRLMSGVKLPETAVTIWNTVTVTSAAGAAIASVVSLIPSGCAEFAQLAVLFDEVIVDRVEFLTYFTGLSTAAASSSVLAIQVFDPADYSALASVMAGMPCSQRLREPYVLTVTPPAAYSSAGLFSVNQNGWLHWSARIPKGAMRASTLATIYGHEWSPLGEAGDLYGVLKTYVEAPIALVTTTYRTLIGYHVRVRSRA